MSSRICACVNGPPGVVCPVDALRIPLRAPCSARVLEFALAARGLEPTAWAPALAKREPQPPIDVLRREMPPADDGREELLTDEEGGCQLGPPPFTSIQSFFSLLMRLG